MNQFHNTMQYAAIRQHSVSAKEITQNHQFASRFKKETSTLNTHKKMIAVRLKFSIAPAAAADASPFLHYKTHGITHCK